MEIESTKKPFPFSLFIALFAAVALLILGGAWYVGQQRVAAELDIVRTHEIGNVIMAVRRLDDELRHPFQQLRALTREAAVQQAIESEGDALAPLAAVFSSLVTYNPVYDKLLWIDESGRERIRVDNVAGQPETAPADGLQDQSQAGYFSEAMRLQPGQVYISPLALSAEHGQVETPHKPLLSLATPVRDRAGKPRGILVLNGVAAGLLDAYTEALLDARDHAMLLNSDGYWLVSPDSDDAWGFMLGQPGRDNTLAKRNPIAWKAISAIPSGQDELADGLWTWSTVYPLKVTDNREIAAIPYWLAVSHLPAEQLAAIRQGVWTTVAISALVLLAVFGGLAAWLARALDGRAHAMADAVRAYAEAAAAKRLSEARKRFQLAVEANATGLLVVDGNGEIVLANPALERMFGYQRGELVGENMEVLLPEPERDRHGGLRQGYMNNPTPRPMGSGRELRGLRKDGGILPVEISLSAFVEDGKQYVDAVVVDISERQRAAHLLAQSEARLRLLVNSNPNGILVVDDAGRIQMANPALVAMFGYGAGEMIDMELDRLVPEASRAQHAQLRQDYLRAPTIRAMGPGRELHGRRKDGATFPIEVSLASFEEEGRKYAQATVVDISARGGAGRETV